MNKVVYKNIKNDLKRLPDDLPKGSWSKQAIRILQERYLDKDDSGKVIETPDEMAWRVAVAVAKAEEVWGTSKKGVIRQAKKFYRLMVGRKFLPNSPTLMNAGKGNGLQYSACFVLPVEDSLEGIFDAIKYQAIIHQSGGGTGFSFSNLRQKGAIVKRSKGVASGPVSFMRVFNEATQQIKQGGTRRGANMGILQVDHPDLREFITCKIDGGITNFNISVAVTDEFMKAVREDAEYDLKAPHTGEVVGSEKAKEIFDLIAETAWKTGDPGIVFIDKINNSTANPVPSKGPIQSTNPCGEQPLYPFDACNLGSIFLDKFVVREKGRKPRIDWNGLGKAAREAVRFLDNVIEINPYPLKQINDVVRSVRRIGLGIGGWGDMLYLLGIAYDSEEALMLARKIMKTIKEEGHKASRNLAKIRGPFELWNESIFADGELMRNATVTTIAPTGSIGILAATSGGCEPVFALSYKHMVKDESLNRELFFTDFAFEKVARDEGFWSDALAKKVAKMGSVKGLPEVPEKWQKVLVTSHQISPEWHVKMQAAWQEHTDNAVSKTVNLPNGASVEDVANVYMQSYELGCMGVTVYRDGSKDWQVLNVGKSRSSQSEIEDGKSQIEGSEDEMAELQPRPERLTGSTYKIKTPVGTAFVVINSDDLGNPFEVFINVGKAGTHVMADAEAIGRLLSMALRIPSALPAKVIAEAMIEQLAGIGGSESVGFGNDKVRSLADGVAKMLKHYLEEKEGKFLNGYSDRKDLETGKELMSVRQEQLILTAKKADLCPDCGQASLVLEEGC
ncbi:vitamin B12-dependent ribonucleotide reductase, partial [Patescibacteria group bacterium]|nr:vitamin B12-dependent ribonucleotide reductase [Patescibacteria group bacterium]